MDGFSGLEMGTGNAFVELSPGPDGKRRRKKVSGKSRGQVVLKRDKVRADLAKGILLIRTILGAALAWALQHRIVRELRERDCVI